MLSCSDCLARHSEYLDGMMDAATAEQWRVHLAECSECQRYDRVVRRGLSVLAAQAQIEPSPNFMTELQRRLAVEDRRAYTRPINSLAGASVAVAAMLAFAAWIPVIMLAQNSEPLAAPIVQAEPVSAASAEIAWHAERAVEHRASNIHLATRRVAWAPSSAGHVIEPKYTPVILESPIAPPRYVRTYGE